MFYLNNKKRNLVYYQAMCTLETWKYFMETQFRFRWLMDFKQSFDYTMHGSTRFFNHFSIKALQFCQGHF